MDINDPGGLTPRTVMGQRLPPPDPGDRPDYQPTVLQTEPDRRAGRHGVIVVGVPAAVHRRAQEAPSARMFRRAQQAPVSHGGGVTPRGAPSPG